MVAVALLMGIAAGIFIGIMVQSEQLNAEQRDGLEGWGVRKPTMTKPRVAGSLQKDKPVVVTCSCGAEFSFSDPNFAMPGNHLGHTMTYSYRPKGDDGKPKT